ncbi:MAG: hypothetical protein M0P69_06800 [Bacteroidales bacterium]|jgi:hypothetical protein|nr:hypothetical protein [Bacteroidales bacterium]
MVDIKGQFRFVFSIGEFDDFLSSEQVETFTVIEEVGNVLPSFRLEIKLIEEDVIKVFNEGNVLKVSYGRDQDHMRSCELRVLRMDTYPDGDDFRRVLLSGLVDAVGWLNTSYCRYYQNKTSLDVIQEVGGEYFDVVLNGNTARDTMTWLQPGITNKRFINEVWLHSNIPDTVPLVGITADKRFIIRTTRQLKEIDWRLVYSGLNGPTDIPYQSNYHVEVRSGFMNSWYGYGRDKKLFDWEMGNTVFENQQAEVFLAQARTLNRSSGVKTRFDNASFINDNVHDNYWAAFMRNLSYLVSGSSVKLMVRVVDYYFDVDILDSVIFLDRRQDDKKEEVIEFFSGRYVVGKVVRNLSNRQFTMGLELYREALNSGKGEMR